MTVLLSLDTVTVCEKAPPIGLPFVSRAAKLLIGCPVIDVSPHGTLLGIVPMLNDLGAVPLGDVVGGEVGGVVGNDVGEVLAVGTVVGGTLADVDGDGNGDDVPPLLTGVGVEPGDVLVGFPDPVGVGPLDALDVGNPPGELVGALGGTIPPVYNTKYAAGGNDSTGKFGCSVTASPLELAGPATVVQTPPCNCAR